MNHGLDAFLHQDYIYIPHITKAILGMADVQMETGKLVSSVPAPVVDGVVCKARRCLG